MFRINNNRPAKSGERVDFRFSNFKALQVPKGWDKLLLSVVSVETGKTITKSSKAVVRNGSCQWIKTVSESVWVSQDASSKELDDCLFKFIVSVGAARSDILGEATINVTDYINTNSPVPVSFPLRKCNHGTILQVKVECMTPKTKLRDKGSKGQNTDAERAFEKSHDVDMKLNISDSTHEKSSEPSSTSAFNMISQTRKFESRESSFSLSESHRSYDSIEVSIGGENVSLEDQTDDIPSLIRRADSIGSSNSSRGNYPAENPHCNHSSFTSHTAVSESHSQAASIEERRVEAKMWERNARRLMLDLEILKVESSEQSENLANLNMELSAAYEERDSLKKEIEQLRLLLEKSAIEIKAKEDFTAQGEVLPHIEKELKDELKFQKESNANLALQLEKSQQSNIELVSILQEMEETMEMQKTELEDLLAQQSKLNDMDNTIRENIEEKMKLTTQLQLLLDSENNLNTKVHLLEQALSEKDHGTTNGGSLNSPTISDIEAEYKRKLSDKEDEIFNLEAKLSEFYDKRHSVETVSINGGDLNLIGEIEALKEKVQELERDCNELTEENLKLLFKLKESKNSSSKDTKFPPPSELIINSWTGFDSQSKEQKIHQQERSRNSKCMKDFPNDPMLLGKGFNFSIYDDKMIDGKSADVETSFQELEFHVPVLEKENMQSSVHMSGMEDQLRQMTDERQSKSNQLDLDISKSHALAFQDAINGFRIEMESDNSDKKQQLENMRKELSQAQEECNNLKRENLKLQTSANNHIEDCSSLQKSNEQLRKEKLELHKRYFLLESKLMQVHKSFANCSMIVGDLEENLSSMQADIASKEKSFASELDALLDENSRFTEKFNMEGTLLNQMYMEKKVEVKNLQEEIDHLTANLSTLRNERERIATDAMQELSRFHANNTKLESDFKEIQSKLTETEKELNSAQVESDLKLESLITELAAVKKSQELLMAENEKLSDCLETYKLDETKFMTTVNDLQLKLEVSEKARKELEEESSNLRIQLQKLAPVQDELLAFKNEVDVSKFEKDNLGSSLGSVSGECENLKNLFTKKISTLKKVTCELENCKREKVALEEKVLQMEAGLKEKSLCVHDGELKKEFDKIRKENGDYLQKIGQIEEERNELLRGYRALEEELMLMKEGKQNQREHNNIKTTTFSKTHNKVIPAHEDTKLSKNDTVKRNHRHDNRGNLSSNFFQGDQELLKGPLCIHQQRENVSRFVIPDARTRVVGVNPDSKIYLLEDEFAKTLEANNMYKVQSTGLSFEGQKCSADCHKKSTADVEMVTKERYDYTKSSLETELRDILERYLHMSLKYAEVEAQREELVMKLKETKNVKRWFS